ncbi:MAG: hypothetical protein AAGD09_17910 [Cyanobacteria bacterium P01_F01_bin.56]
MTSLTAPFLSTACRIADGDSASDESHTVRISFSILSKLFSSFSNRKPALVNDACQYEIKKLKVLTEKELRTAGKAPRQTDLAWVCQIEGLEMDIYASCSPETSKLLT